jgi:hypothetical protein
MKIRTQKKLVYDPMTFEPTIGFIVSYSPDEAQDEWKDGGANIKEQLINEFRTLLTRETGWDSESQ